METKFFLSCIALLLGTLLPLPPQSMFASITGTIADPSGAAVAGAPVVAVNRDSNYRYANHVEHKRSVHDRMGRRPEW